MQGRLFSVATATVSRGCHYRHFGTRPRFASEAVEQQSGLKQFMSRVFVRMGTGVASTLGVSILLAPVAVHNPFLCLGVGGIAGLGSAFAIDRIKPTLKTAIDERSDEEVHTSENPPSREVAFWALTGGMGAVMAPLVAMIDPEIVITSVGLSTAVFGGCAFAAVKLKNANLMSWQAPLGIGLLGLIGLQLTGLGAAVILGPNIYTAMVHNVDIYGGLALFTAMSIYDVHAARKMYEAREADHLGCAANLYLDFINILIRVMEIMAKAKKN